MSGTPGIVDGDLVQPHSEPTGSTVAGRPVLHSRCHPESAELVAHHPARVHDVMVPPVASLSLAARRPERALRISWHHEDGLVILSLWRDTVCSGTFRLAVDEVPDLIDALRAGLDATYDAALAHRRPRTQPDAQAG